MINIEKNLKDLSQTLLKSGAWKESFVVLAMEVSKGGIERKIWKVKKLLKLKDIDIDVSEKSSMDSAIRIEFDNLRKPVKKAKIFFCPNKLKKHIESTGQDLFEILCHEFCHILAHNAGVKSDDEHDWIKKKYPEWAYWTDVINFPDSEHKDLKKRLSKGEDIITTRVSDEQGVYERGQKYVAPWGVTLRVTKVKTFKDISKHPFESELTDEQKKEISKYKCFDVIWLK